MPPPIASRTFRQIGEVAKLMTDVGSDRVVLVHLARFAPNAGSSRDTASAGEFVEIYVEAPLETVIARDPKGLYKRALAGEIQNFTGVDQPYEAPEDPELILNSADEAPEFLADRVIAELERRGSHIPKL